MSDVEDIKALVEEAAYRPVFRTDQRGREIAFIPHSDGGYRLEVMTPPDEVLPKPAFIAQRPRVQTTKSLITYIKRFKTADTMLFADVDRSTIVAAIDYHQKGSAAPGLVSHQATLTLPTSIQWNTWLLRNCESGIKNLMVQEALAEFIQENYRDFLAPEGLDMLALVLNMEKTAVMHVGRQMKRAGSDQGSTDDSMQITGTDLPPEWTISIPVYRDEAPVTIKVYAREKLHEGKNMLGYKIAGHERIKEEAFFAIAKLVAEETAVEVVLGSLA